ncbi:hypothetical protein PJI17_16860 [Mycobacterium kansasii]|uniref:Uncharacterized protein n=1 Tax=Mycobacterium kansasii TaxID=1768 RepID=A0A1V3XBN6_MYCKA|nr:hypothetical protein I547_6953 [Mycobacterium kansasii 824]OOK72879.1 hypothetical protein BZL29_4883 [Mycobacterium kansasii]OOK75871.1 hypothetical protein BZL30_3186 [Mycobacterium kansasii]
MEPQRVHLDNRPRMALVGDHCGPTDLGCPAGWRTARCSTTSAVPGETTRPLWDRHGLIGLLRTGAAHAIR